MGEMTPEEFAAYVETIKDRVAALISGELVPSSSEVGEKVPAVHKRLIIDRNNEAWAARLRSDRHIETVSVDGVDQQEPVVHAFMVGYGGIETRPSSVVRTVAYNLRFTIDSYYQDVPGTDADNAEKNHGSEIFRATHVLMTTRPFGVAGVARATEFRERRGLAKMGDTLVRESLGELWLELDPIAFPFRP